MSARKDDRVQRAYPMTVTLGGDCVLTPVAYCVHKTTAGGTLDIFGLY